MGANLPQVAPVRDRFGVNHAERRTIILGASNVMRSIASVVSVVEDVWQVPQDIMIAAGHGRSYGIRCWVIGRSLPSILSCQLWQDLTSRPALPTSALLTDIGNDVLYGSNPETIAGWVEACLQKLRDHHADIAITELPLERLRRLSPTTFYVFRNLFFPGSSLSYETGRAFAEELNERVCELAKKFQANLRPQQDQWYGLDPIHLRLSYWADAWSSHFGAWRNPDGDNSCHWPDLRWWLYFSTRIPHERAYFGFHQGRPQPQARTSIGSRVSFY